MTSSHRLKSGVSDKENLQTFSKEIKKLIKFAVKENLHIIMLDELRRELVKSRKYDEFVCGATHVGKDNVIRYIFYAIDENLKSKKIEEEIIKLVKVDNKKLEILKSEVLN